MPVRVNKASHTVRAGVRRDRKGILPLCLHTSSKTSLSIRLQRLAAAAELREAWERPVLGPRMKSFQATLLAVFVCGKHVLHL